MSYIIVVVLVIFGLAGIRIADQYVRGVVFRLGRYHTTKGPGLYWIIPLIEWQRRVDLRINTAAVEQQETITKDNVPIKVNAVVWYRVVDPKLSVKRVRDRLYRGYCVPPETYPKVVALFNAEEL